MVPVIPLAAGTLGGVVLLVYLGAILYLYLLLIDIRQHTKETAETLDRIAVQLDDTDEVDEPRGETDPAED